MAQLWPPPPSVEDEEQALAREYGSGSSRPVTEATKSPSDCRGSVDQLPIIQDANVKREFIHAAAKVQNERLQGESNNTRKQYADPIPVNNEKRFVFFSSDDEQRGLVPPPQAKGSRSKSTTRLGGDETPRGRPHISRFQTDVGAGLKGMATGQRRAPSPYSYMEPPSRGRDVPIKESLLSPENATDMSRANVSLRRSRSARPSAVIESSDSDKKPSSRGYRSRSRHERSRWTKTGVTKGEELHTSSRSDRHGSDYRASRREPSSQRADPERTHRSAHGDITPPKTPKFPRESPYNSASEDSDRRRRERSRHPDKRYSKDSSHLSSADEGRRRKEPDEKNNANLSSHSSIRRTNQTHLELPDTHEKSRFASHAPPSARSPEALEDYFQRAYEDNQLRQSKKGPAYSAHPSPCSSPPQSPPKTPIGDRSSKDYFELNSPLVASKQRSRPPSTSETAYKGLNSLLGAATLGAASLAAKAVPSFSRTSTASLENPAIGSQTAGSFQRSRKPSPVHADSRPLSRAPSYVGKEDHLSSGPTFASAEQDRVMSRANSYSKEIPIIRSGPRPGQYERPISRAGSYTGIDEAQTPRANTLPTQYERPTSRAGSLAGYEDSGPQRSSTYPFREEIPMSRSGPVPISRPEYHPTPQRTSSYSSYHEQAPSRPSSRRLYSATNDATITMGSAQQPHTTAAQTATWSTRTSSIGLDRSPTSSAPVLQVERRAIVLPPCPYATATAGMSDWYTVQGVQDLDICKSCMSVLGNSAFRDYCMPSRWRPQTEAVACSLGRPWVRLAVTQCLQKNVANLPLLSDLTSQPPNISSCPGKQSEVRKWYHITDPGTKQPVQNFDACKACVKSTELLFPELAKMRLFERPDSKLNRERVCNLNTNSKHFYAFINKLEELANWNRTGKLRKTDIPDFAAFVRQKTRLRECQGDAMLAMPAWHYMRQLPEFTVCEECYEEVVLPIMNKPVARDILPSLQPVPYLRSGNQVQGISCQLYSGRMRSLFKDAVTKGDIEGFKRVAYQRYHMEHRLQEKQSMLIRDLKAGIDRREEIERNSTLWKAYE